MCTCTLFLYTFLKSLKKTSGYEYTHGSRVSVGIIKKPSKVCIRFKNVTDLVVLYRIPCMVTSAITHPKLHESWQCHEILRQKYLAFTIMVRRDTKIKVFGIHKSIWHSQKLSGSGRVCPVCCAPSPSAVQF